MKRRNETPPPGHPLPTIFTPGGWIWDPSAGETGEYVAAQSEQAPPAPLLLKPAPKPPEPSEVI